MSGLAVVGLVGLGLMMLAWQRRSLVVLIKWGSVVGGVALVVAGWWYVRNWLLFGDPLALQAMFDILPRRAAPPTMVELIARGQGVWRSVWAVFGWFSVAAEPWLYTAYSVLCLAGLTGLLIIWPVRVMLSRRASGERRASRTPRQHGPATSLLLLGVWVLVIFLALLSWAQMRYPQGRLLFPALSSATVLLSLGLTAWLPRRFHAALAATVATGMLALALIAPWRWIAPAYAAPAPLPADAPLPNPVTAMFGDGISLAGYTLEETDLRPGDTLFLTLYWRAEKPIRQDFSVFVHLVDDNEIVQAQRDSYPGAGSLPTSQWTAGAIFPDQHALQIPLTAPAPSRLKVKVGLYDHGSGQRLLVGGYDHWTLGYVTLLPRASDSGLPNPVSINFDNQIALVGFEFDRRSMAPGEALQLTLWWEALTIPRLDYVVFTHLILPPDAVWAGSDQMPQAGAAPTSAWSPGQRIKDQHLLTLPPEAPPGVYFVEIGLYDTVEHDRLMVDFSDKGIVLGQVKVLAP